MANKHPKRLYIMVTRDKYEQILAVDDSAKALAVDVGVSESTVSSAIANVQSGRLAWSRYQVVELDDEEEGENDDPGNQRD